MDKKLFVIVVIVLIVLAILLVQQKGLLLSPAFSKLSGCSIMGDANRPPMTNEMKAACNQYCDYNFPGQEGCKDAVKNLKGIPASCRAEQGCIDKHFPDSDPEDNEIYPPATCEIRERNGVFTVNMDCEICGLSFLGSCYCENQPA